MVLTDKNEFRNSGKAPINSLVVSHNDNITLSCFAIVKHTWNSMLTMALNTRFQNMVNMRFDVVCS